MPGRASSLLSPFPYRGGKRKLAPAILRYFPSNVATLYEPFAGSGAVTLHAAAQGLAQRYFLGDVLVPLAELWRRILESPEALVHDYELLWMGQFDNPRIHYDLTRKAFNADQDPVKLLYLLARCVKNAIRFNQNGEFNQAADHRRSGFDPETLRKRLLAVAPLRERSAVLAVDYRYLLRCAQREDLVYMDPPYQGAGKGRESRYYQSLYLPRFLDELETANARGVSYLISFDGRCGDRTYGPELPVELGLRHVELRAGRSSQATLNGRADETIESLYLSPALLAWLPNGALP